MKKYIYSIDDLDKDRTRQAFNWVSFDPKKRGEATRNEYINRLETFIDWLDARPETDEEKAEIFNTYKAKILSLTQDVIGAYSRCASSAITGGSGFNVRRAENANRALENKQQALWGFTDKFKKRLLKADKKDVTTFNRLLGLAKKKLNPSSSYQAALYRSTWLDSFGRAQTQLTKQEAKTLVAQIQEAEKDNHYKLITKTSKAFKIIEQIAKLGNEPATKIYYTSEGLEVIRNRDANRFQLFFDGVPAPEVRTLLKGGGFRWSPKAGAWLAYLTTSGRYSVDNFIKKFKEIEANEN